MTNQEILALLLQNTDKNFVQRLLSPGVFPVINNDDGSYSTHLMSSHDNYVFPMITQNPSTGQLQNNLQLVYDNPWQKAFEIALKQNDAIRANSPEDADQVARNYKQALGW
jgi:hypothetical protein